MATKINKANLPKGAKVYNSILSAMPTAFSEALPRATASNIGEISTFLLDNNYQPNLNSFITTLINRIGLTIIHNKDVYENPLARFKKESVPLGDSIQEIFVNPAEGEAYDLSNEGMSKLLTITDPDTHSAYYQLNRKDKYPKTIQREMIQQAFVSWDTFEEFITEITNSLYSGNYIDEFLYTKQIIDDAYIKNKMLVEVINEPTNEETGKSFIKLCKKLAYKMQFPSTKYNAFSHNRADGKTITTWTPKNRMCILIKSDVLVNTEVDVLAAAFNMSKVEFEQATIAIDEWKNSEILAVVCDESLLQIRDSVLKFDDFYNASTMSHNIYLHSWGYFNLSPFANGVIIATKKAEDKQVTEMNFADQPTKEITSFEGLTELQLNTTPEDTSSNITFSNENDQILTISRKDNKTVLVNPITNGSSKITASSDNGKTCEINVTVNVAE